MLAFCRRPGSAGRLASFLWIAAGFGVAITASLADEPARVPAKKGPALKIPAKKDWKIEIIPGPAIGPSPVPKAAVAARQANEDATKHDPVSKPDAGEPKAEIAPAGVESALPPGITPASYAEVYNSIPFRRSEYLANPSYRHEATIELLLGQIRPKTVVNVTAPSATCCAPQPATFVPWINPWGAKNFYYHYSYSRPTSYWLW